jgi:hypothetical protein
LCIILNGESMLRCKRQEQCQLLLITSPPESFHEDSMFSRSDSSPVNLDAVNVTRDDTGYRATKSEINSCSNRKNLPHQ